jgi:hypothetical protein
MPKRLQRASKAKNEGQEGVLRDFDTFTRSVPAERPVETVLQVAVDEGVLPEKYEGMNSGADIVATNSGYYLVDTSRHDPPALKTDELYSGLRQAIEDSLDKASARATNEEETPEALKSRLEQIDRAKKEWLEGDNGRFVKGPSRLDRLKQQEIKTIEEISSSSGRPFAYVSSLGTAWIDQDLAKEKMPKLAAALKTLAPHGTLSAQRIADDVCGMVKDLYSGEMQDFNPTLLGGEIWSDFSRVLEPPKKRPKQGQPSETKEKRGGLQEWVGRHKKLTTAVIAGSALIAGIGINSYLQGQQKQERVNHLIQDGTMSDRTKAGLFDDQYVRLVGKNGYYNSSVESLATIFQGNSTLANIVERGARTQDGDIWGTVGFVADNLNSTQYLPKSLDEAKWMSRFVKGVDGITALPAVLNAYTLDADVISKVLDATSGEKEAAFNNGAVNVAKYMTGLIKNGNITIAGFNQEDLQRLLMPIELSSMDIFTGVHRQYNLETFVENTVPKSANDISPLQWQGKILNEIKTEKGLRYNQALYFGNRTYANVIWPDAAKLYRQNIKDLPEKNDILFVYGIGGLPFELYDKNNYKIGFPIVSINEPLFSMYDTMIGMHFGIPVKVRQINYYNTPDSYHYEPCVRTNNGKYVGMLMHPEELKKAYIDSSIEMDLEEISLNGNYVKVIG